MFWYKDAVFYEINIRAFCDSNADGIGDFGGLTQKLDYFNNLGIDCLWLLPMYPSPLVDDGYDISDYFGIHPDFGTLSDFKYFLSAAHDHGIHVISDLVINHTSDQHPWFIDARRSRNADHREYYIWSETDQKFKDTRIIFVDTQKSNWQYDPTTHQYYFHRFYPQQPDLNYDNPAVQQAMIDIMDYWLNMGLDGFRVDAVPYIFKREGTNCENLPETHAYLRRIRRAIDDRFQRRMLLAEANQWPKDVRPYLGQGDEFHMAFNFPLMPRIFIALAKGDYHPIVDVEESLPPIPESAQWCTFLRNHDELSLEMVSPEERQFLWDFYAPEPRMRLNLGIRRRLAPLLGGDRRKIELANSILFTLPGAPILYYGDEIGMGDNIWLKDRVGVRTPMQWDSGLNAGFSDAPTEKLYAAPIDDPIYGYKYVNVADEMVNQKSLWHTIKWMIACRKGHRVFSRGECEFLKPENQAILAYIRTYKDEVVLVIQNLSGDMQRFETDLSRWNVQSIREMISKRIFSTNHNIPFQITLMPYEYLWLLLEQTGPFPAPGLQRSPR